MKLQKIYIVAGLMISVMIIVISVSILQNRLSIQGKAASESRNYAVSQENSYVFASPITAQADGRSVIRITVFLSDDHGLGLSGREVRLEAPSSISIQNAHEVSDSFGRATFDLISNVAGDYSIKVLVSAKSVLDTISVTFQ